MRLLFADGYGEKQTLLPTRWRLNRRAHTPPQQLSEIHPNMCVSYSVRVVFKWCCAQNITVRKHSSVRTTPWFITGVRVQLNKVYWMSIQTSPELALDHFAQSAILTEEGVAFPEFLGYFKGGSKLHAHPEDLFAHINAVLDRLSMS